jgi:MraZ protein
MGQFGALRMKILKPSASEHIVADQPEASSGGNTPASHEADGQGVGGWDELQVGFIGNPRTKLDDRGRLKMPAEFKAFIEKKYGKDFTSFYITSLEGKDAEIFPMPEWQRHLAKIFAMPKSLPVRKKLLDRYNLWGDRAEMDPQGRLLMPEELRNAGLVNVEVKVAGEGASLRVTSLKVLRENVSSEPITPQEQDVAAGYGV